MPHYFNVQIGSAVAMIVDYPNEIFFYSDLIEERQFIIFC